MQQQNVKSVTGETQCSLQFGGKKMCIYWCELQNLGDISHIHVLLSLRYDGTKWHSACGAKSTKNTFKKTLKTNVSFQKHMTQLRKIIHKPCCEHFDAGTTFFLVVQDSTAENSYMKLLTSNWVMYFLVL